MPKPPPPGPPRNQPTNHTIYGSREGAQVLLLALCGLPDLPFLGGRSLPTFFSAHLTIFSPTHHAPLPWHAFADRPIAIPAFLEHLPYF